MIPPTSRFVATALIACLSTAIAVADDKPKFDRWEGEIAAFERKDKENPPPKNGIHFAGSSSIRFWNLSKSFPDMDVINRGFGGSQLADSTHFAPRIILKHEPRMILLYAGDNDIAAGKSPKRVRDDFEAFVNLVHEKLPKTKIAYISIKPSILRWNLWEKMQRTNQMIEAYCKDHDNLEFIDITKPLLDADGKPKKELFRPDGLHLNEKGYAAWADVIKPRLK